MEVSMMDEKAPLTIGQIFEEPKEKETPQEIVNRFSKISNQLSDAGVTDENFFTESGFSCGRSNRKTQNCSKEDVVSIIESGNDVQLRELSNSFFYSSGFYRRLLTYYSTILYYTPLIIPIATEGKKKISDKKCSERYYKALDFADGLNFEQLCRHFTLTVLRQGAYYGLLKETNGNFVVQDLPYDYCRTRLKSYTGVNIIEFNVDWFDKIKDENLKKETLKNFPKEIRKAYLTKGKKEKWVRIPMEQGIHFTLYEDKPFFAPAIPSIVDSKAYVELEKARDSQQLRSLVIQEIDHTSNGDLVIEPEESVELHKGLTKITKANDNIDGITTYGKIKVERLLEESAAQKDNIEKISKVMYMESGVSRQLFAAEGNSSVERSIQNDISTIYPLAEQYAIWLKVCLNSHFADKNVKFSAVILPVGQYNYKDYMTQAMSSAQYGYSSLIPAVAMGISQNEFINLKELENELYNMTDLLLPLRSSHTENGETTGNGGKTDAEIKDAKSKGASKADENRSEQTIKNRESSVGGET
jgi:hypothetical protein